MPHIRSLGAVALLATLAIPSGAQGRPTDGYHTAARLGAALDSIARSASSVVRVTTLATSPGRRPVQVVRVGASDTKPAVLVLAGAYGPQISSSEVALRMVRNLASLTGANRALLDNYTIYIVPRLNPDASEAFFGPLRWERTGNDAAFDDDRDMANDEDGPNDLNGDGIITMMRVKAHDGEWMVDAVDPALMRRADATKGERGMYRLLVEGRDDDNDGEYNEDVVGGTDISRNFANNFRFFGEHSGLHPFSAEESRAVAEFMSTHDNIGAVYVLGMQDNLIKAWEGRRVPGIGGAAQGTSAGGPLTASLPEDNGWFTEVSRRFKVTTGFSEGPATATDVGDPLSWSYFHMGRFAFGSRVWWPGKAPADTAAARRAPAADPLAAERNDYRWMKANNPAGFVEWTAVQGFTIDGQAVEVGGFAPGAQLNPAGSQLDSLAMKHTAFVTELAQMMPTLAVPTVTVTEVGPRVYRISAVVQNNGYLPSNAAIGVRSRLPQRARVELVLSNAHTLSGGRRMNYIGAVRGSGGTETFEWVVVGAPNSTITLNVGSPHAGLTTQTITLRAR